ncbi:ABC transporter substrate-binding protein [Paenibacillus hodogayensis]|uniref:ABC transporter substrate-binding protein n=1 Tax=Paenibacillus hodogayensis TaxID=279208 RepID=A0ABV5W5T0_9BACL
MKRFQKTVLGLGMSMTVLLAGCGDKGTDPADGNGKKPEKLETVTLNFLYNGYSKELLEELKGKVENHFPNIKLNVMLEGKGNMLEDVVGAGISVDAIARSAGGLPGTLRDKLVTDLTPYMTKYKFDVNRFSPGVLETVKSYSDKGEFLIMPYELNNSTLYFNKSLFDKFGVPYPTDNMTWDQVYDITKKMTRVEGGVNYKGFKFSALNLAFRNQMGLPFADPATGKTTINTDPWKKWVESMVRFYDIPGNEPSAEDTANFFTNQTLAMMAGPSPLDLLPAAVQKGLDWDVVTLPNFEGMKGVGSQMNAPFYSIMPNSKYKDETFEVLAYIVSDEIQAANARKGHVPVLRDDKVLNDFGKDLDILKGKNVKAFYAEKIAKPVPTVLNDGSIRAKLSQIIDTYKTSQQDLNSMLRKAEEDANKQIEEQNKK